MDFCAHGEVKTDWQNNVLIVRFATQFNLKGAIEACDSIEKQIVTRPMKWARIDIYENQDVLAPPESFDFLDAHIKTMSECQCALFCIINGNVLIREYFSVLFQKYQQPFFFCSTLDEAMLRINAVLAR
jgi:hypothetical protein